MTFEHRRDNSIAETRNCRLAHERAAFGPKTGLNRSRKAVLDIRISHRGAKIFSCAINSVAYRGMLDSEVRSAG